MTGDGTEPAIGAGAGESGRAVAVGRLRLGRGGKAWTHEQMRRFFDALATGANVRAAAGMAGIDHGSCYRRRAGDAAFRQLWNDAVAEGIAGRAMQAVARALDPAAEDGDADGEAGAADGAGGGGVKVAMDMALKLMSWHDAREKRHARGGQVACMPIDEVERILLRRIAVVERRLARTGAGTEDGAEDGAGREEIA